MSDGVRTESIGAILEVTLDRPKANAIGLAMSRRLNDIFSRFRDDSELRVAIVTGAGDRFFCAGWDLKAASEGEKSDEDWGPGGFGGFEIVLPDAGTIKLPRRIPYHIAVEFLMTGRWMDAAEAKHWGLANHVVPQGAGLAKARLQ
jgi:crotonobetainyl-CoA hydratase